MRAVQRAARSLRVSTRGTACGAFVQSSKNGDGRPSPSAHQPNIFDARRAKTPSDGGAGAFGGDGPTQEGSWRRHKGRTGPTSPTPNSSASSTNGVSTSITVHHTALE